MMSDKLSQTARILKHLKANGQISNTEMWNMRIQRGSERIRELRAEGHLITSVHDKGPRWVYIYRGTAEDNPDEVIHNP